ncbi:MAG: hypothetical protein ACON5F_02145 [Jejuia sp.]
MKKIKPYKYADEALAALDNGGRFYNILTKANDGIISQAELGKVGGVFNDKQQMVLFFEMATSKLDDHKKQMIISKMETKLQQNHNKFIPLKMTPSEAKTKAIKSSSAILEGIPKRITSKTDFKGFIMIPLMVGNVTTFMMIPLIDQYDVYELRDELHSETFIIAHARSKKKLPETKLKVAGVFKELKSDEDENSSTRLFLEVVYYSDIPN